MRSVVVFFVFCLLSFQTIAQKIIFADKANIWYYKSAFNSASQGHIPIWSHEKITASRDTTINGKYYVKIYDTPVRHDTANNNVYLFDDTTDLLLYDYTLQVGDTFHSPKRSSAGYPIVSLMVDKVDSVLIDTIYHKRISLKVIDRGLYDNRASGYSFVEGIGCLRHPLYPVTAFTVSTQLIYADLQCFKSHGKIPAIFTNCADTVLTIDDKHIANQAVKAYPQPAYGNVNIELPNKTSGNITVLNTAGQVVYQTTFNNQQLLNVQFDHSAGIYFYQITDSKNNKQYRGKLSFY